MQPTKNTVISTAKTTVIKRLKTNLFLFIYSPSTVPISYSLSLEAIPWSYHHLLYNIILPSRSHITPILNCAHTNTRILLCASLFYYINVIFECQHTVSFRKTKNTTYTLKNQPTLLIILHRHSVPNLNLKPILRHCIATLTLIQSVPLKKSPYPLENFPYPLKKFRTPILTAYFCIKWSTFA